jgi:hypothetical protein
MGSHGVPDVIMTEKHRDGLKKGPFTYDSVPSGPSNLQGRA